MQHAPRHPAAPSASSHPLHLGEISLQTRAFSAPLHNTRSYGLEERRTCDLLGGLCGCSVASRLYGDGAGDSWRAKCRRAASAQSRDEGHVETRPSRMSEASQRERTGRATSGWSAATRRPKRGGADGRLLCGTKFRTRSPCKRPCFADVIVQTLCRM